MIALYLLAAHLVGDFVLQTRWQAAGKFGRTRKGVLLRLRHVTTYSLPFVPLAIIYAPNASWSAAFMVALFMLHFLTDSRRFLSTLGDWVAWLGEPKTETATVDYGRSKIAWRKPLESNPWPPIAILIDQTLHVCQIALLAGIYLS